MTPDTQQGRDTPPSIHEDHTFPQQGSRLAVGQHILDQPPYNKLSALIPDTFFENTRNKVTQEHGLYLFIKALGEWPSLYHRHLPATLNEFSNDEKKYFFDGWIQMVNPTMQEQRTQQDLLLLFQSIERTLAPYPYVYEYLSHKSDGFNGDGSPKVPKQLEKAKWYRPEMTFAAYQHDMIRGDTLARNFGLAEILPLGYATQDDIRSAMPQKGTINKTFRLLVQSEAVK